MPKTLPQSGPVVIAEALLKQASLAGREARLAGRQVRRNPFLGCAGRVSAELARYWEAGWYGADLELALGASEEGVRDCRFLPRF